MNPFLLDPELLRKLVRRFAVPSLYARAQYFRRYRALVSPRAEVDYSSEVDWGPGCIIASFTKVKIAGHFRMGRRVHIGTNCFIGISTGGVTIGDNVMISPNCTLVGGNYVYDRPDVPLHEQGTTSKGITIGDNSWIGANSCILDGSVIGANVIVVAGSVVSGEVPDRSIVQGNPAKVIFKRR